MNERDTQFQGFARLLWEEMLSQTQWQGIDVTAGHIPLHHPEDEEHKTYIDLIARRAYDLVAHVMMHTTPASGSTIQKFWGLSPEEIVKDIPDLTEWPVEPNEPSESNPA